MTMIKFEDLSSIREKHPDKKIVYCSGVFDLTHPGHILFFEDCKKFGDILVVGIGNDSTIKRYKGPKRPILNEKLRLKMISSLKSVDYSFIDIDFADEGNILDTVEASCEKLKPDVYIINQDAFDIPRRKLITDKLKIKMVILDRFCPPEFDNVSTTSIIEKIKNLD